MDNEHGLLKRLGNICHEFLIENREELKVRYRGISMETKSLFNWIRFYLCLKRLLNQMMIDFVPENCIDK